MAGSDKCVGLGSVSGIEYYVPVAPTPAPGKIFPFAHPIGPVNPAPLHRLMGYLAARHRLGVDSASPTPPPPPISRTEGLSEMGEAAFESSHGNGSKTCLTFFLKPHFLGQEQVKCQDIVFPPLGASGGRIQVIVAQTRRNCCQMYGECTWWA